MTMENERVICPQTTRTTTQGALVERDGVVYTKAVDFSESTPALTFVPPEQTARKCAEIAHAIPENPFGDGIDQSGWSGEFPWTPRRFSERIGVRQPDLKVLGFRWYRLKGESL